MGASDGRRLRVSSAPPPRRVVRGGILGRREGAPRAPPRGALWRPSQPKRRRSRFRLRGRTTRRAHASARIDDRAAAPTPALDRARPVRSATRLVLRAARSASGALARAAMSRLPGRGAFASLVARALANAARSSSRRVASGPAFSTRPPRALAAAPGDAVAASTAAAAAGPFAPPRGVLRARPPPRRSLGSGARRVVPRPRRNNDGVAPRAARGGVTRRPRPGALDPARAARRRVRRRRAHRRGPRRAPRGGEPPGRSPRRHHRHHRRRGKFLRRGKFPKTTPPPFGSEDADRRCTTSRFAARTPSPRSTPR